jgi:hypothetical protein
MLTLMRLGGAPMIAILLFGALSLASAFWYAVRPNERLEGFIRGLSRATLFSICAGTAAAIAATFRYVAGHPMAAEQRTIIICEGLSESMSAAILGFSFLALVALMEGVGKRRLDARRA